jgi:hypothetical protein
VNARRALVAPSGAMVLLADAFVHGQRARSTAEQVFDAPAQSQRSARCCRRVR